MSRERRFHVDEIRGERLTLPASEAHHLVHVLRLREGAEVSIFDGKGNSARARIEAVAGGDVELRVLGPEPSRESPLRLTLAVSFPRGDRASFLVEKLTELGVSRIILLETERGRSRDSLERWQRIALEACKQSGRSQVPVIDAARSVASVLAEPGLVLAAHPKAPPLSLSGADGVLALVGPEGGWTESELSLMASRAAKLFGLGPRTLRTETAAIAAATLIQSLAGDINEKGG